MNPKIISDYERFLSFGKREIIVMLINMSSFLHHEGCVLCRSAHKHHPQATSFLDLHRVRIDELHNTILAENQRLVISAMLFNQPLMG